MLASACCIVPLVLVMLGISGAWIANLTALEPYKPYVAAVTLARLDQLGWPVCIAPRLHDIDEPGDLIRLPAEWSVTLRLPR